MFLLASERWAASRSQEDKVALFKAAQRFIRAADREADDLWD